jgi:hypothetical protein
MAQQFLENRAEKIAFAFQAINGEIFDTPVYRLVIDMSYGAFVGKFQKGYYITFNNKYFVVKSSVDINTPLEAEKVFTFLSKTKTPFTISVRHEKTLSNIQYVVLSDIVDDSRLYTIKQFNVFKGLWRTIEGAIHQTSYYPNISRFTGEKLDWYLELYTENTISFNYCSDISATYINSQGHLDIYKLKSSEEIVFPSYLYKKAKDLMFYNHVIQGNISFIPIGVEQKIIYVQSDTKITSSDHEEIVIPLGEYLLVHPKPNREVD